MQKHFKMSNISCLFTYHDLQIQFQYQNQATKIKLHQSIHIELKLFHANFQNGPILSTLLFEPLNYQQKIIFFIQGATLDLPIININQNKPNVCHSLLLQVYFKEKVLWIAGFYMFGLYNNKKFWTDQLKVAFFLHFQNSIWRIWQILKICKIEKFEICREEYHNTNFQTSSKSSFFKKGRWKCHFFAKCISCNFKATIEWNFK